MAISKTMPILREVHVPARFAVRAFAGMPSTGRPLAPVVTSALASSSAASAGRSSSSAAGLPFMMPSYEPAYLSISPMEAVKQAFRLRELRLEEQRRHEQLEAELFHFKHVLRPRNVTLQEIREFQEEEPLRQFLAKELPIRWAHILQLIESLPGWGSNECLQEVHAVYEDAFKKVRKVDTTSFQCFRSALQDIERRTSSIPSGLVQGIRAMHLDLGEACANNFLDTFMKLRIGTDILTSQYLGLARHDRPACVVQLDCNVANIVRSAAEDACKLCEYHYCHAPDVDVTITGQVTFPCISQFLDYIMFELLKNSSRAVVERYGASCSSHPIKVAVLGDDKSISVKISDEGGGITADKMDKVWSYLWTTAKPQTKRCDMVCNMACEESNVLPMAGFGCGLPLSRCYAGYVGADMFLDSTPHHGTVAYLRLNRPGCQI